MEILRVGLSVEGFVPCEGLNEVGVTYVLMTKIKDLSLQWRMFGKMILK